MIRLVVTFKVKETEEEENRIDSKRMKEHHYLHHLPCLLPLTIAVSFQNTLLYSIFRVLIRKLPLQNSRSAIIASNALPNTLYFIFEPLITFSCWCALSRLGLWCLQKMSLAALVKSWESYRCGEVRSFSKEIQKQLSTLLLKIWIVEIQNHRV